MFEYLWNMYFNISFSLLPFTYMVLDEDIFMNDVRPYCIHYINFYYILDGFWELLYHKRTIYIPHHVCSMIMVSCAYNTYYSYEEIKTMFFVFALLKYTSLFVNIRTILKKFNKLELWFDCLMYLQYVYIRCILYTSISYNSLLTVLPIIPNIGNVSLIVMSYYWVFLWTNTLIAQFEKKYQ
jgi:hypothetical protein